MVEDSTMSLKVTDTGSLSVNQYGWINIWTAILGHFFAQFPAFFEDRRIVGQNQGKTFLTMLTLCAFMLCFFSAFWV
ncbi:hypothetical protein R5D33_001920 [Salmonella enterica]|uniref:DUF2684 family protein n=1 Tax=Salmonella enterica subsp. VII serovar 40:z4,z24:[z39] TaxID=1967625 RepID=A0A731TCA9_SALEE|nr:hypothetical protein [Salmonella enterica]EDS6439466.1 hypothetical protein [Salmonella enterica subsp. VII str. CFSAN000550]EDU6339639.1 hypothetical protein [Salmonella enterica subsp. houtenae serovar 40:z4,z24:-]EDU7900491.1 hypothetical protein [Salmonella enterica subsp. houtenae]QJY67804.1 hypothetical protein HPG81_15695 [Salmonella enterica subsp. VII serovar 1,40:g,z51:--]QUZ24262.1 hypothetical protein JYN32_03775 [Salmonella enterica subsp. VII str. CFSAN000554]HAE4733086.1 hyp